MKTVCIACGFHITIPIYHPQDQPLTALGLPRSPEAASNALRFPMNFHACARCGHIFNVEFDYYHIPYEEDSNLMYNSGSRWLQHLSELAERLVNEYGAAGKTLIDIGCGDGLFLEKVHLLRPETRCIGFEPGIEAENARKRGNEVYKDYFHPERDLVLYRPDILICRHVVEHLDQPLAWISNIAYWCNIHDIEPLFLVEVPCIDRAVEEGRINDYLYEHVSNFTKSSFRMMFERAGYAVEDLQVMYDNEILAAIVRPIQNRELRALQEEYKHYHQQIQGLRAEVRTWLEQLIENGKKVALWGGTGKGASFINGFGIDREHFPVVVDSDCNKWGRFVPGTGQEIRSPEALLEEPFDTIIITTQWRARDIADEIESRGIRVEQILVQRDHTLIPYTEHQSPGNSV